MTFEIGLVLLIIAAAIVLFITEVFSIDTTSILIMLTFVVTGVLTPEEGFSGFTNKATLTVGAMFVLSTAIFKTGALNGIGKIFYTFCRWHYLLGMLFLMVVAGVISAFINDTAVVALMLPMAIDVSRRTNISASRLLMPLSFGALLGGVCTLIGTSTNILVSGIAQEMGHAPISMFELTPIGVVFLSVGIAYMLIVGPFLLPNNSNNEDLSQLYNIGNYITELRLLPNSKSVGKLIREAPLVKDLGLDIIQVRREDGHIAMVSPYTVLRPNDVLTVRCNMEKLKALAEREGVKLMSGEFLINDSSGNAALFEAMIAPHSEFVDRSLSDLNFRQVYSNTSVLAIRSRKGVFYEKLSDLKLQQGDVLLLRALPEQMKRFHDSNNLVVISEVKEEKFAFKKILPALGILSAVITVAALDIMPIVMSASIGVISLIVFKIITPDEAYRSIEWKVIFMLAGVLSMGTALEKTGGATLLANLISDTFGNFGPQLVLSLFFLVTFLATNIMSNNATAALMAPIAITTAASMDISARPLIIAVTMAASLSFMTPMSYQTNTMIYSPGNYKFMDYIKVGTPLNILFWILATWLIPQYFPFELP